MHSDTRLPRASGGRKGLDVHADPGPLADRLGPRAVAAGVDAFYDRVQRHPTLAGPFRIVGDWPTPKPGSPIPGVVLGGDPRRHEDDSTPLKHFQAGCSEALRADWLARFAEVQQELLPRDLAADWLRLATGMGTNLARMNAALTDRAGRIPG